MQKRIAWNREWFYKSEFQEVDKQCDQSVKGFEQIELPHTNRMLPLNGFCEEEYQFVSCYKKKFYLSESEKGKQIFLDFEGVMIACEVFCNGESAGSHEGGYLPFSIDLTPYLKPDGENVVVVQVDSTERKDIPPFGNVVDYLTYGGIYREVSMRISDGLSLEKLWISCKEPLKEEKDLQCVCDVCSDEEGEGTFLLSIRQKNSPDVVVASGEEKVWIQKGRFSYKLELTSIKGIQLWDMENPRLYKVEVSLELKGKKDVCSEQYGFRSAQFRTDGFFLNGKHISLVGLNRHQSWPYNGYAMPKRVQRKDAEIIKNEAGCNIVRTSHYPQSRHFLDACDELGLLVMEEIPGWQHIGDSQWKEHSYEDVRGMIRRDFNRPSVILWGVRINESQDDHEFYLETNRIARELDPIRQTGGTRYIQRSEFLEDVYTYNDFTHDGGEVVFRPQSETTGLEEKVPLLVTESNGHMYPTKKFDQESRVVEHAMRHLRVINESVKREDFAGGISWCAFDYNTHSCFGSGDKICYHGVYDMFRNPKFAAFSYRSQKDPIKEIVLEPITAASRGERDGGGTVPFYILTNCDFVRVYKNGSYIDDFYPDQTEFPYLEHPPVIVSHLMEKSLDFGMEQEDAEEFRQFLLKKVVSGELLSMSPEDFQYIQSKAETYDLNVKALYGEAVKAAGGWGECANNFVLEGYFAGECVCVRKIGEDKQYSALCVKPDDVILEADTDTYDATRIVVSALDQNGNVMPFVQECVEVKISGEMEIMGPSRFPLIGGTSAFWVRTKGTTAQNVNIEVSGMYQTGSCEITVMKRA